MKLKLKGRRFYTTGEIQAESQTGSVPKMEETVGPVSTCRRELLLG
jgi:hypothetical protein